MPIAVTLAATERDADPLLRLWDEASQFEPAPSMRALGYVAHITLGIYDDDAAEEVDVAAMALFAHRDAIRLRFRVLACFDGTSPVLYAAPDPSAPLLDLHGTLQALMAPESCHAHYRPGSFVPHSTLAMRVAPERRELALDFMRKTKIDCKVVFGRGDVVAFPPARVLSRYSLHPFTEEGARTE